MPNTTDEATGPGPGEAPATPVEETSASEAPATDAAAPATEPTSTNGE